MDQYTIIINHLTDKVIDPLHGYTRIHTGKHNDTGAVLPKLKIISKQINIPQT